MDGEKNLPEEEPPPTDAVGVEAQNATHSGGQRIQFIPTARPERGRPVGGKEDAISFVDPIQRRSLSVHSIPQVISGKDKHRRQSEKEEEKKHVDSAYSRVFCFVFFLCSSRAASYD
jgi:hypothetical protein